MPAPDMVAAQTTLHVSGLTLMQSDRVLIKNASFDLFPGDLAILTGGNGQGKTTLLRAILGLHNLSHGVVHILGKDPCINRAFVGYLPQNRRLAAPQLSVRDHIASAWQARRLGPFYSVSRCRQEVSRVCELVKICSLVNCPIGHLSGGEKQRVFLAIALLGQPQLLLLDEPLTGVDDQGQQSLVTLLDMLRKEMHLSILLSTHDTVVFKAVKTVALHLSGQFLKADDARL